MADIAAEMKEFFERMPSKINAEGTTGLKATIQFTLTGDGGGNYYLQIDDGTCSTSEGTCPDPQMSVTIGAKDYLQLVRGTLDGEKAFMTGKLKIAGDMGLAMKLRSLLKIP